ncbi:hypothetical protein [Streptomyces sp. NPDC092903]|uniref:hypothetical protein n=1 Tax=Streptomyces sp. NPDC092903 TaxID=3366017 RepID=UPI0038162F98
MIQHVRRKIAGIIPANPEVSIPLSVLLQTAVGGAFQLTLRLSSVLQLGVVATVLHREPLSQHGLMMLMAAAWSDRSILSYVKVWRRC